MAVNYFHPIMRFASLALASLMLLLNLPTAHPNPKVAPNFTQAVIPTVEPVGINFSIAPKFNGPRERGKPGVSFDGANFFTAWRDGSNIYAARVSPQGNLLDTNGIAISINLNDAASPPSVSFDGINHLVVWAARRGESTEIYAARVTKTGTILDPGGLKITSGSDPFTIYDEPQVPAVAFDGTNYLVVWGTNTGNINGVRISTSGTNLDSPEGFIINMDVSRFPAVAYGGDQYLVTWQTYRNETTAGLDVYAARVLPDGSVLDPGGFVVAGAPRNQDNVSVTFASPNFLVLWVDWSSDDQVHRFAYAARVSPDGIVMDDPAIPVMERVLGETPTQAACNDSICLIAGCVEIPAGVSFRLMDVFAVRMTKDGQIIDQQAIPVSTYPGHQSEPVIAFGVDRFLVAFNEGMGQLANIGISGQILQVLPVGAPSQQTKRVSASGALLPAEQKKWVQEAVSFVNGAELSKVIAFSPTNAYAFDGWGHVVKYDGNQWQLIQWSYAQGMRFGLYASGPNDIWVGGNCRGFIHFNGVNWEDMGCNGTRQGQVSEVISGSWGTGPSQIWVAANFGEVLKYISNYQWQTIATGTANNLADVWGTSANNIYAVGERGTIMRYNGTSWSKITGIPTLQTLNAIWGSGPNDIFAVGDWGTILHYDGVSWKLQESGTTNHLFDLWGLKKGDLFAVGYQGTILHYDGFRWQAEESGTTQDLLGVWGALKTSPITYSVWASGTEGTLLKKSALKYTYLSLIIK